MRTIIFGSLEASMASAGAMNSTVYIFRAKNFQGMVDKQEVVVTPNANMSEQMNAEDIVNNIPKLDSGD